MEEEISQQVLLFGFIIAVIMGFVGNRTQFCTMGAVSDWVNIGEKNRLRAWLLSIAVAILGVSLLEIFQFISIETSRPPYRMGSLPLLRFILGGVMFGVGMTLASGCGNKTLIRIGGGNIKSIFVFLVCGAFAYLMTKTVFYEYVFHSWISALSIKFSDFGYRPQSLGEFILGSGTTPEESGVIGVVLAILIGIWVFYSVEFREQLSLVLGGLVIGAAIVGGWYVTSGPIGKAWQETAEWMDQPPIGVGDQSYTFINPMGETLVYFQSGLNELLLSFGVCSVAGVIFGSFLYSIFSRSFHLEWFPSVKDFFNHLIGAILMGIGGVLAMGCTIGQAVTGSSTLSIGSFIVFFSILLGSAVSIKTRYYLLYYEGEANLLTAIIAALADIRLIPKSFRRLDPI